MRLLTIHAAKGLEFKVVVVADAGRDARPARRRPDEILALSDGRLGFKVAHPVSGEREGASSATRRCAGAGREAARAERLRLYYVAMTRAIDRLLVSGAHSSESRDTPIGWVLSKLDCEAELAARPSALELERGGASFLLRRRPLRPAGRPAERRGGVRRGGRSSRSSTSCPRARRARGCALPELEPCRRRRSTGPPALLLGAGALRALLLPLLRRACRRPARARASARAPDGGLPRPRSATPCTACSRSSTCATRVLPTSGGARVVPGGHPRGAPPDRGFADAYCDSRSRAASHALPGARPERPFAFSHDGVLLHGRLDVLHRDGAARAGPRLQDERRSASAAPRRSSRPTTALQRLVYALACFRAGADEVEIVYALPRGSRGGRLGHFSRDELPALEAELSAAIARIDAGEFVATPGEFTCSGCPALDVVCAGPRLRGGRPPVAEPTEVAAASSE